MIFKKERKTTRGASAELAVLKRVGDLYWLYIRASSPIMGTILPNYNKRET